MSDQVRINGRFADGAIVVKVAGEEYQGFTEIGGYKAMIEEAMKYGLNKSRGPMGRTGGVRKFEKCTLAGPLSTTRAVKQALALSAVPFGGKVGDAPEFLITVTYFEGLIPHTDELLFCRVLEDETKPPAADSPDAVIETLTIQPRGLRKDGVEL